MQLQGKKRLIVWLLIGLLTIFFMEWILEFFLELLYVSFELIELALDISIEHLFHTDVHTTQIITFYILLFFSLFLLYRIFLLLPGYWRQLKNYTKQQINRSIEKFLRYWHSASWITKLKWYFGTSMFILIFSSGIFL